MTREETRAFIVGFVTEQQGCKMTLLCAQEQLIGCNIIKTVEELVMEGELVEIEYVLPSMQYRIKSFLLPKNTNLDIKHALLG